MTGNPIHDLLDNVSSGAPGDSSVSVDALVRGGRRRQRGIAVAAAGTTAGLAAIAVAVAYAAVPGTTKPSASGGFGSPTATISPAPATSIGYPLNGPVGGAIPINGVSLLKGGTEVNALASTVMCAGTAQATVVSQTDSKVVLSLRFGQNRSTVAAPGQPPPSRMATRDCNPRPTAVAPDPAADGGTTGTYAFTLSAPLGSRQLIDASTGKAISYTTAEEFGTPHWIPAGYRPVFVPRMTGQNVWEEMWNNRDQGTIMLGETYQDTTPVTGVNTTVSGHPARFGGSRDTNTLEWVADGRHYSLWAAHTSECKAAESQALGKCVLVTKPGQPISEVDLLRIANSITVG